jgi:pimeloyl-ACP methyl ester carboxylesterase
MMVAVQKGHAGSIAGIRFGKVITIGHSLGSTVVWQEAITYADVDGVIVTGAAHALSNRFIALASSFFHPAVDDPKFGGSGLDPGYLTSVPGIRASVFYALPDPIPPSSPLMRRVRTWCRQLCFRPVSRS